MIGKLSFITDTGTSTQLWLVTEFLPNGSLFDFLEDKNNIVGLKEALQFIRSIAHGLAYLHTEVPGVNNQCRIFIIFIKTINCTFNR